jgi:heat shock protein HslJ
MLLLMQSCHYGVNNEAKSSEHDVSPMNASFSIEQRKIVLINGHAEQITMSDPDSKIISQVWGSAKIADLNADGQQDAVLILTQHTGGSGTYYYLAVAIREGNNYQGTAVFLLGDRIQPQDIQIEDNRITVKLLDRLLSEPYSNLPTIPKEKLLIYDPKAKQLINVEQDFAGEADPSIMTLNMKTWYWEKTEYNNDTRHRPALPKVFSLKFEKSNKVLISTDCNSMHGDYRVTNKQIAFSHIVSTRMFCKDSQEQLFAGMLANVNAYFFTSKGQLVLDLKYDSGSMIFR